MKVAAVVALVLLWGFFSGWWAGLAASSPQEAIQLGGPEVFATFHAAGIRVYYTSDANRNASLTLEFRRVGEADWRQALPPARIQPDRFSGRFAGSIFHLFPGTEYEARVFAHDPDRTRFWVGTTRFKTQAENFPTGTGRTRYVKAGAKGNGTKSQPFGSIQEAVDAAGPGDGIVVGRGTYRESVLIKDKQGRPDAYILLRGEPGARITGAIEELEKKDGGDRWHPEGADIFSTLIQVDQSEGIGYVAAGEERLYRYDSLDALRKRAAGVAGGWYWEGASNMPGSPRRLYVALPDGSDPDQKAMHAARLPHAFRLENSHYWIIEGLDIGFFGGSPQRGRGYGIYLEGSSNVVVRRNRIHHSNHGVYTTGASTARILVEENEIYDTSIFFWPWDKVKRTEAEGGAVSLKGGPGQVVRRNKIRGYFNGVTASTWGSLLDETRNTDLDIYENQFTEIGDDPVEPEGACINLRIWGNTIRNSLTAVSLAPITVGPTYVLRNTSLDHGLTAVKFGSGAREGNAGVKYILHNTFVTTRRERRLLDGTVRNEGVNAVLLHQSWENATFLNNIFAGTRYTLETVGPGGLATFDYDNLYSFRYPHLVKMRDAFYSDLASFQKAGHEPHGLSAPSRFADLEKGDLRLVSGSPEIDRALRLPNINDDFFGAAPDIGAFELRSGRP